MSTTKKIRDAVNKKMVVLGLSAMSVLSMSAQNTEKTSQDRDNPKDKKALVFSRDNYSKIYEDAYVSLEFQTDTITPSLKDIVGKTMGYYSLTNNSVTLNYYEGDENEKDAYKKYILANHEKGHMDYSGNNDKEMSMEQQLNMYRNDEIRSRIIEVIAFRQGYIESENKQEFLKKDVESSFLKKYIGALKDGKYDPMSINPQDFEKEMRFIGIGAKEDYVESLTHISYDPTHLQWVYNGVTSGEKKYTYNAENYKEAADRCFTIGGYNFAKVMDLGDGHKVEMLSRDREASMKRVSSLVAHGADERTIKCATENVAPVKFPEYDGKISVEQYYCLLQHHAINEAHKFQKNDEIFGFNKDMNANRAADAVLKSHYLGKEIADLALKAYEQYGDVKPNDKLYAKRISDIYKSNKGLLPEYGSKKHKKYGRGIVYDDLITSPRGKKGIEGRQDLEKKLDWHNKLIETRENMLKSIAIKGEPKYFKHGENGKRVSEVMSMKVINSNGNFLIRELEAKKRSYTQNAFNEIKGTNKDKIDTTVEPVKGTAKVVLKQDKAYE